LVADELLADEVAMRWLLKAARDQDFSYGKTSRIKKDRQLIQGSDADSRSTPPPCESE
jgi:sigma54-dependent transcription regulator